MVRRFSALILILIFTFALAESIPRHVNPDEVMSEGPSPLELLTFYRAVVDAVLTENYSYASIRVGEAFRTYAPEDLKYVFNRFNELLACEVDELNLTRFYIDLIRDFMVRGFIDEARGFLDEGVESVARANLTYSELLDVALEISRRFRLPRGEFLSVLAGFEDVISKYYSLLYNFSMVMEELNLTETSLTVNVNCSEVWVGSPVFISGFLSTVDGFGLSNRNVTIFVGALSLNVTTDGLGFFGVEVNIPYVYRDYIEVYGVYVPVGLDSKFYLASKSNVTRLKLRFLIPTITANLNVSRVKPGDAFMVSGFVSPMISRCWFRVFNVRGDVDVSNGHFNFSVIVPVDVDEGFYWIDIGSYAEGVFAPSNASIGFEVYRLPLNVSLAFPWIAFSGFEFEVDGRVFLVDGGGVFGARVVFIGFESRFEVSTDVDGGFKFKFNIPYTLFSGWHTFTVYVDSRVPWIRDARISRRILIVNPFTLVLPVALALISIRFVFRRVGGRPTQMVFRRPSLRVEVKPPGRVEVFDSVSSIYFGAVGLIEDRFGLELRKSETVREYLGRVRGVLGEAYRFFEELSFMLEDVVYGGVEIEFSMALRVFREFKSALMGGG